MRALAKISASPTPPMTAKIEGQHRRLQRHQHGLEQHHAVLDQRLHHRQRARQHIGRQVVEIDHRLPGGDERGEHGDRQQPAEGGVFHPLSPQRASIAAGQRQRGLAAQPGIFRRGAEGVVARLVRVDGELGRDPPRPGAEDQDARGQEHRFEHRMGDEDDGAAELSPDLQEVVVQLEAGDLVERGEGLVHQQQARLGDQRPGDGDAHLHAAGELARIGVAEAFQPDQFQRLGDGGLGLAAADPGELERQVDIGEDAGPGHQRRLLEHEADGAAALGVARRLARRSSRCAPAVGSVRPAMRRSAVDLPQPEGPSSERNSPCRTSMSRPSSAVVELAKRLPTPSRRRSGEAMSGTTSPAPCPRPCRRISACRTSCSRCPA